ncbi:fumarate reductase (quinol) flavoprotein subunit [Aliifodinibius sp. S!AR15-10]|uniref:fumarate reductase (quinol) flavoprotein subunit n=1 Tax=Aliifodinibius sp. S!AR15-10 TaxID=2950437 RepID=UPI00285F3012|nr:fumarate reductase (quinol) flavoprotein subunit [Aliifodinibius sp. S!AR15-10]MDR8391291.1 fumarate reductase (quinol) flavoprotein subunit [Aliifodinibius sp. S!AR15-10]
MSRYGPNKHDVLIVGGGGAGLRAAIAVAEYNPNLSIAVVSKVYPMRSHTVSAEGGAAAVIKPDDSFDDHAYDTISGGDWMCDQDAVEAFVKEAPDEMLQLEHWGCPWSREESGKIAVRPFGGMKVKRTWFAADKTGFHLLHTMFQTTLKYDPIHRYDEYYVTSLLVDEGRCQGVIAIELATGRVEAIAAKSVIMCTGGCGQVFPFTTNGNIKTGDGMALAYRVGVPLKDMEFVQYHPTGLPFTGLLITEAARAEGGHLLNKDGYRYLQDYDLGVPESEPVLKSMELGPRDRLSQAFVKEQEKGRTINGEYGSYVYLDIQHLGEEVINSKLPFVRELCLKYENIDPVEEMIPVRPVVHYMMGGIDTDIHGATTLDGLFAAGETACVSINGANRLGSNSLTELLVFGARAGKAAAEFATEQEGFSSGLEALVSDEEKRIDNLFFSNGKGSSERIATIRDEMHQTMEAGAGIYRNETSLKESQEIIQELKDRMQNISIQDQSYTFNTELVAAFELTSMLDLAEAIIQSALQREESRGSHQRSDFTERDDDNFLAHSMAYRTEDGLPSIEYKPVTITRWPPGKRVYGQQH